jgi:hypothetical protein
MDSGLAYIVNALGVVVNVFLKLLYPENIKSFKKNHYSKATSALLTKVNPTPHHAREYAC